MLAEIVLTQMTSYIIVGVFVPLAVGLLTKLHAPAGVKVAVNLVLTAVVTLIVNAYVVDTGVAVISDEMLSQWIITTVISIATYYGVYKPLAVPGKLAPTIGLGPSQ
jgi:hypothetical protein